MSEHSPTPNPEAFRPVETEPQHAAEKQPASSAEKHGSSESKPDVEHLQKIVDQLAASKQETTIDSDGSSNSPTPNYLNSELKEMALSRTMNRVRKSLKPSERTLSKVVHAPGVDTASNLIGSTIARPMGLLGGGICAFIGSLVVLFLAKKYGFTYNFAVFLILLVGGYLVGSLAELIIKSASRMKRR